MFGNVVLSLKKLVEKIIARLGPDYWLKVWEITRSYII